MADFLLPPPPPARQATFVGHAAVQVPVVRALEPVGPYFNAHARRIRHQRTLSQDESLERTRLNALAQAIADANTHSNSQDEEDEDEALLRLDPREWKSQDHYRVLGLSKLRYRATDNDIQSAFRKKVLKHHPDKKVASGTRPDEADRFFKCIQKAYDILMDPVKRRQWDSVDPGVKEDLPKHVDAENFYEVFAAAFDREARFYAGPADRVPRLGDAHASQQHVEAFYAFWYHFPSWRSFEYHDKDEVNGAENRDDKRWLEKKNKAERQRLKKADNERLRKLVDLAASKDPRMLMFKQQGKQQRQAKKLAREEEERLAKEAKQRAEEEAARLKQEQEEAERRAKDEAKKDKEAKKKAAKKEKKLIKALAKDHAYFSGQDNPGPQLVDTQLEMLDRAMKKHEDDLEALRVMLEQAVAGGNAAEILVREAA